MKQSSEYRAAAWQALSGNWGSAVLAYLVLCILSCVSAVPLVGWIGTILLILPLSFGFDVAMLKLTRNADNQVMNNMFNVFKWYSTALGVNLLVAIYTFLWTLLLVVPGIIKAYAYSMSVFIANDNPDMSIDQAITKSMDMMKGHKMELFLLDLSFIGWWLLGFLTLGIGLLWVVPYVRSAHAAFYQDLLAEQAEQPAPATPAEEPAA